MKLQTMLLPTGEFIIVGSEARPQPSATHFEMLRDAIKTVKAETGAAAFFLTDDVVEVENALVDSDARRSDPSPALKDSDESHVTTNVYLPYVEFDPPEMEIGADGTINLSGRAVSSGWIDVGKMSTEFASTLFGKDFRPTEADLELTRQIADGAEFTPAGLVKGKPGDPDFLRDPQFARGGEPGADPEPEVVHAGQDWDIEPTADLREAFYGKRVRFLKSKSVYGTPLTEFGNVYDSMKQVEYNDNLDEPGAVWCQMEPGDRSVLVQIDDLELVETEQKPETD